MKTIFYIFILFCCLTACKKPQQDDLSVGVAIPNAFRPPGKDGVRNSSVPCIGGADNCNSVFMATISNPNNTPLSVSMIVYDQNSRIVYSSTALHTAWDGTEMNHGVDFCPQGNYHYQFKVMEVSNDKSCLFEGDIALLR